MYQLRLANTARLVASY